MVGAVARGMDPFDGWDRTARLRSPSEIREHREKGCHADPAAHEQEWAVQIREREVSGGGADFDVMPDLDRVVEDARDETVGLSLDADPIVRVAGCGRDRVGPIHVAAVRVAQSQRQMLSGSVFGERVARRVGENEGHDILGFADPFDDFDGSPDLRVWPSCATATNS